MDKPPKSTQPVTEKTTETAIFITPKWIKRSNKTIKNAVKHEIRTSVVIM